MRFRNGLTTAVSFSSRSIANHANEIISPVPALATPFWPPPPIITNIFAGMSLAAAMPDHLHGVIAFPREPGMKTTIEQWKRYLSRNHKIDWQRDFFDHRLRDHHELHREDRLHPEESGAEGIVRAGGRLAVGLSPERSPASLSRLVVGQRCLSAPRRDTSNGRTISSVAFASLRSRRVEDNAALPTSASSRFSELTESQYER